jgi:hypothetical protein
LSNASTCEACAAAISAGSPAGSERSRAALGSIKACIIAMKVDLPAPASPASTSTG